MGTEAIELRNAAGNLVAILYLDATATVIEIGRGGCNFKITLPPGTPMEFDRGKKPTHLRKR